MYRRMEITSTPNARKLTEFLKIKGFFPFYLSARLPVVTAAACQLKVPMHGEIAAPEHSIGPLTQASPAAEKIDLFRSLFRGREDVYPRRFESRKTGKTGYSPACANEWVRGVCEKPRIK